MPSSDVNSYPGFEGNFDMSGSQLRSAAELHLVRTLRSTSNLVTAASGPEVATWTYNHASTLLLGLGRLFTPTAPPVELGLPQRCWNNATFYAEDAAAAVYVEGLAVHPDLAALGMEIPHAWCAIGGVAIDPARIGRGRSTSGCPWQMTTAGTFSVATASGPSFSVR